MDLDLYLGDLYRNQSDLLVPFFCSEYGAKKWCQLEWRQMRDILLNFEGSRIMPFRFYDAPIEGMLSLHGYIKVETRTPQEVAGLILERITLLNPPSATEKKYRSFTANLPTVSPLLIGREDRIDFLDKAWANPDTNFVQIIAPGGTGKTALVDKWFRRYVGKATIFGWSFYSQGTSTKHATSSDAFFAKIMTWFGVDLPASASVYDKVDVVVESLRKEKVLLILDGVEPLQDYTGTLLDSALKALLHELNTANEGMVLCTTRLRLDIPDDPPRAVSLELENLSPEFGGQYLRKLGVDGDEQELQQASKEFGNHALALTLLGTYLVDFLNSDIRRRVEIPRLMIDESKHGAHASRMMAAYEQMFAGKHEGEILRALGFFNRPADPDALKLVLPVMKDLQYQAALNRLYGARLVLSKNPTVPADCHPLIREHFAAVMRSTAAKAFREGHARLYEHYRKQAPEQPDTLEEMTPLFYAVYHGCQAGRYLEALNNVYRGSIRRGEEFYLLHVLGAFGADLSLLSNFFETPWTRPNVTLPPDDQTWLLGEAGFTLRALGRLSAALVPLRSAAEDPVAHKQWLNAAIAYNNLSELLLHLGQVKQAITASHRAVDLADRSGEWSQRVINKTTLGAALLAAGNLVKGQRLFAEAERIQSKEQPGYPILYSLRGFLYCDLLLEQDQAEVVIRRATQTLRWVEQRNWPLDIGLDHLSLGRSYPSDSLESSHHLNRAVHFLRQSGMLSHIPLGLLARGTPHDLDEVFRIASRSGMRLYLTDYHLTSARLALKNQDSSKAREHLQQAEKLINETGYHRRDKPLEELRAQLGN